MNNQLTLNELQIQIATEADWKEILGILEETGLTFWFVGGESYKNFYVVKDQKSKKIICTFAIDYEKDIGILKSFGIPKSLQGKGIGKIIANETPRVAAELGIKKFYAVTQEAPGFWQKTIFKEIKLEEGKEEYFLNYLKQFCHKIPDYYNKTHYFLYITS